MLFKRIKYFVAVVDHHSFTKAALECDISQSAISQQIQALEKELDATLIVREKRSFSLTQAGIYFYMQGKDLLKTVAEVKAETKRISHEGTASPSIIERVMVLTRSCVASMMDKSGFEMFVNASRLFSKIRGISV